MAEFSDYYEDKIIDHMLRGVAFTQPATIYVALFTADTGLEANNPSAEASGGSYAREAVTLSAASSGTSANSAAVTFTTATGSWGTVSDYFLTTASAEDTGDMLLFGTFDASSPIIADDQANIPIGDLDIVMAA